MLKININIPYFAINITKLMEIHNSTNLMQKHKAKSHIESEECKGCNKSRNPTK